MIRGARITTVVVLLVVAGGAFSDDAAEERKREEERIAARKELKKGFNSSERLVANTIEAFALETFRDREKTLAELAEEKPEHLADPLRYYLLDEDWEVVALAAMAIGRFGLTDLAPELTETYEGARYAIVRRSVMETAAAFARQGVEEVLGLLVDGTADPEPGVRLGAADGLEAVPGEEATKALRSLVDDDDPDVRYRSRTALARLGDEEVQDALLAELESFVDSKAKQRRASLVIRDTGERYSQFLNTLALGQWGSPRALKELGRAFLQQDPYENKVFLAVGAATAIGRARPADEKAAKLVNRILELGLGSRDATTRALAALAAGYAQNPDHVKRLRALIGDPQVDVRHNAVEALGRMGPDTEGTVVPILVHVLRREKDVPVRLAALRALNHFPSEEATKGMLRGLGDDRYMVRAVAAQLLGRRGVRETGVVRQLDKAAADRDYGVRENAVVALSRIGDEEGLPAIVRALSDADVGVRVHGLRALLRYPHVAPIRADEDAIGQVVGILTGARSPAEVSAARQLLIRLRSPLSVPPLLRGLEAESPEARNAAFTVLRAFTRGQSFGYAAALEGTERREAVARWKAWWDKGEIAPPEPAPKVRANLDIPVFHQYARDLRWRGVDLVLAYDSTGSMIPVIRAVKQRLDLLIREAYRIVPNLRMSLFTYRDEGEEYIYYGTPLTYAMENLKSFVQVAEAKRGGDLPEAITETIMAATRELNWREEAQKVIVVIGDAPYHPENEDRLFRFVEKFATRENRGIVHAIYTDPSRLGETISARKEREESNVKRPFLDRLEELAEKGRGRAITIEDTEKLISEILVLSFGERWRDDLELRLEFR